MDAPSPTKHVLLARPAADTGYDGLRERLHGQVVPALLALEPHGLKLTWTDEAPPWPAVIPFRRDLMVLVSLWGADPAAAASKLGAQLGGPVDRFAVHELPGRDYARDWVDGVDTPGVGLFTQFRRRAGLADEVLAQRWQHHAESTQTLHPIWNYVRNQVTQHQAGDDGHWDGLVEEQVRQRPELTSLLGFFGGWLRAPQVMVQTLVETRAFIDYPTMRSWLVAERWVRSPGLTPQSPPT